MNQVGGPVIAVKDLTASERQHIIRGWKRDEYIKLAPGYFIEREQYEDLSREDQITARIVAHACSAETTVVVGPSAAHLWQMPVAADNETLARQPVNLASTTMRPRKTTRVRYRKIGRPHEGCVVELSTDFGTVRVTDQLTTALDLARWATLDDAVRALDDGLQQETFTVDEIADRLGEMNRVVGGGQDAGGGAVGQPRFGEPAGDGREAAVVEDGAASALAAGRHLLPPRCGDRSRRLLLPRVEPGHRV